MNPKLLTTFLRYRLPTSTIVLVGSVGWLLLLGLWWPAPFEKQWAWLLLLLAPLVLVPIGLEKVTVPFSWLHLTMLWQVAKQLTMPAAVLLSVASVESPGWLAVLLATPWLLVTGLIAWVGLNRARDHLRGPVHELALDAGLIYLPIGAAWTICDRFGYRPLDFEPVIVLLTGIHFHYAGFVLPLITGLVLRENKGRLTNVVGIGVIGGVPLVAAGITLSQLKMGPWLECGSAVVLALAAGAVAVLQIRLALRAGVSATVKTLWLGSSACLLASMALAALYGARFYLPVEWLTLEWMGALHGTANALGFALLGLVGWWLRR